MKTINMHMNASAMANTATPTPRMRKHAAATLSLPPAAAHELDVLRAARQGIDISGMAPDERCKYPSKFCCHKRARKTTGKLHRFCEYHRTRARLNQKRWTDVRRRQDRSEDRDRAIADTTRLLSSFVEWSASMDADHAHVIADKHQHQHHQSLLLANALSTLTPTTPKTRKHHQHQHASHDNHNGASLPSSPTAVDSTHQYQYQYQSSSLPLSDDEIEQLMTLLVEDGSSNQAGTSHGGMDASVGVFNEDAWVSAMWLDAASSELLPISDDAFDMTLINA